MNETIIYTDPKMVDGTFNDLTAEEKIRHHVGIMLGIRKSVGGICVRASDLEIDDHAARCPEDYARLRETVCNNLVEQGYILREELEPVALAA